MRICISTLSNRQGASSIKVVFLECHRCNGARGSPYMLTPEIRNSMWHHLNYMPISVFCAQISFSCNHSFLAADATSVAVFDGFRDIQIYRGDRGGISRTLFPGSTAGASRADTCRIVAKTAAPKLYIKHVSPISFQKTYAEFFYFPCNENIRPT